METVVGVEGNDEGKVEETGVEKSSSALSSPKQIADPVVYKLVRVEGDGRLVPATDDELMEVEDFLEDDKSEMHDVADSGQTVVHTSEEGASFGKTQLEGSEVPSGFRYLNEQYMPGLLTSENSEVDAGKLNARPEEIIPSSAPSLNDNHINQSGTTVECPKPLDKTIENVLSASAISTGSSSKPDFSKLEGEICLDKLSIRELHEVFKAAFGRETTVKDKLWLKRRIAMGLTNSCDVSTTTFTIKDNKLVKEGEEDSNKNVDGSFIHDPAVGATDINCKGSPASHSSQMEDHQIGSDKNLRNQSIELDSGSEHLHIEERANKRVRKPTKRYIEELSEVESRDYSPRLMSSPKNAVLGQTSPKSCVRPVRNFLSDGRTVVTRLDSLGGSGVQVPYVSRVRRSRPRKNVMALMKFNPTGMDMAAQLVKKALVVHSSQTDDSSGDKVLKKRSAEQIQQPLLAEVEKDRQHSVMGRMEREENLGLTHADSSGDNSDDNVVTVPTAKGGMRRKHHRAWTLSEVVKLVEGVSKCGAGRWSEIKRLAFASYSYRTSVDLKDKWRNLLKASFAQTPPDDGMNSRKPTSMPIPETILVRVRELAEMNAQVPPSLGSTKPAVGSRNLHETRSGYL
ncbi:telomere repeat-binding protein 6 [Fagus crenata]